MLIHFSQLRKVSKTKELKTSFLPNFTNKTTSVEDELCPNNQPNYLIYVKVCVVYY